MPEQDNNEYAVYYVMPYPEPPFDKMERRYVHPWPNIRQLCSEPKWMNKARADVLAKEYGGTIIKKGDPL